MLRIDPRSVLPHKIEATRLVLRAPIRGDVPALVKLADNRRIAVMLAAFPSPYTRADAIGFVEIMAQRADHKPYAVTLDDTLIGIVSFSYAPGAAPELGYWLGEPYWGQGYATEAAQALIETAEATGQYQRIGAWVLRHNAASIRVLEKLRFRRADSARPTSGPASGERTIHFIREQGR